MEQAAKPLGQSMWEMMMSYGPGDALVMGDDDPRLRNENYNRWASSSGQQLVKEVTFSIDDVVQDSYTISPDGKPVRDANRPSAGKTIYALSRNDPARYENYIPYMPAEPMMSFTPDPHGDFVRPMVINVPISTHQSWNHTDDMAGET